MALGENVATRTAGKEAEEKKKGQTAPKEQPAEKEEVTKKQMHFCIFGAGGEEYAIPIDQIREVVKYREPAPIPQMPEHIIGMTNIRGNIYGVMDLELFFQVKSSQTERNFLLVLGHESYKMSIAIPRVPDSLIIEEDQIEELKSSNLKSLTGQKFLKGVIRKENRMIILIDVFGIISSEHFARI